MSTYVFYCSVSCSITQDVALGVNPATLLGPRRFPVSRNFIPAAGPLRAPRPRPHRDGEPLPAASGLSAQRDSPGTGTPASSRRSQAEGKPRRWTRIPSGARAASLYSNCPPPAEARPAVAGGRMPARGCRAASPRRAARGLRGAGGAGPARAGGAAPL